jgi:hypothetical protein
MMGTSERKVIRSVALRTRGSALTRCSGDAEANIIQKGYKLVLLSSPNSPFLVASLLVPHLSALSQPSGQLPIHMSDGLQDSAGET